MEGRAKYTVADFLVVNHDARLREKSDEAIRDTKFCGGLPTIISSSGAPKIKLRSISFKPSYVFDHTDNWNASSTH
jgi:hypothetical protein